MIAPRIIAPGTIASGDNCPRGKVPPDNCSQGKLTPRKLSNHHEVSLKNNYPHSSKFPQRVLQVNWGKLYVAYEYYNIRVLELRSKKWFTTIYFSQILTKPCRTPFTREHFSLNASWFSYTWTQKNTIFWKNWFRKKYKKYFI